MNYFPAGRSVSSARVARESFTSEELSQLRPHVVNLTRGGLSQGGSLSTNDDDIRAIFQYHLPKALKAAKKQGRELPIVFYAHGGLVPEQRAMRQTLGHIGWWKKNSVYPIYFIWETGFWETIFQMGGLAREMEARGDTRSFLPDPLIEAIARGVGRHVWTGIKDSARMASEKDGAAFQVAENLKNFCAGKGKQISLHAVGHSAGAVFHSHFVPVLLESLKSEDEPGLGLQSLHLLAPALTIQDFQKRLAVYMGKGGRIGTTTIFNLQREMELSDNSAFPYGKSLLYLVHNALEAQRQTPILGLWDSFYANADIQKSFGVNGKAGEFGTVIWSPTDKIEARRSVSSAQEHGDFDNDRATMGSVLRRILRKSDEDEIYELPVEARGQTPGQENPLRLLDWPEQVLDWLGPIDKQPGPQLLSTSAQSLTGWVGQTVSPPFGQSGGRRRALCVGINAYQSSPLTGCVADARLWAQTLGELGFETHTLLDGQATFDGILNGLRQMVQESRTGDVLVFQYAGHGIQLPDVNGDEVGEDTATQDEAICPYDYTSGRFVLDDDIAEVFSLLKSSQRGVSMTCFIDCCHSGTISRFAVGVPVGQRTLAVDERVRVLPITGEMVANHRLFRRSGGRGRSLFSRGPDGMSEIVFSACLSSEKAYESNQQGDFTRHAIAVLRQHGLKLTNEDFERRVRAAFGSQGRQHPNLDCAFGNRQQPLFQPLTILG